MTPVREQGPACAWRPRVVLPSLTAWQHVACRGRSEVGSKCLKRKRFDIGPGLGTHLE
jgi:hypothetical protein